MATRLRFPPPDLLQLCPNKTSYPGRHTASQPLKRRAEVYHDRTTPSPQSLLHKPIAPMAVVVDPMLLFSPRCAAADFVCGSECSFSQRQSRVLMWASFVSSG